MHTHSNPVPTIKTTFRTGITNKEELSQYEKDTANDVWVKVDHSIDIEDVETETYNANFLFVLEQNPTLLGVIQVTDYDDYLPDGTEPVIPGVTVFRVGVDGSVEVGLASDDDPGTEGMFLPPDEFDPEFPEEEEDDYDPDEYIAGALTPGSEFWNDTHFTPDSTGSEDISKAERADAEFFRQRGFNTDED